MSSLSPSGSDQNTPTPPQQPRVSAARPDRGAGLALAGFLCGLTSLIAAMLSALGALGAIFGSSAVPGFSYSEGTWLLVAAFPVALVAALVGLFLSVRGRHSTSRRWLAIAGLVLSVLALVLLLLIIAWLAWFYAWLFSYCSTHGCY